MTFLVKTFEGKSRVRILLIDGKYYAQDKYTNKRYLCKVPNASLIENFCYHYRNVELDIDDFELAFKEFKKFNK